MRKATKTIISFAVVLIAGLKLIVPAFAQDPFTAIAVGGISGASGAGLFGSMSAMSGIDIGWGSNTPDQMDAMWNVLNPDHVYFSGEKHEADPQTYPEDIYDYIEIDIGDWLEAQTNFIREFAQVNNVSDNDDGTVVINSSWFGIPIDSTGHTPIFGSLNAGSYSIGPCTVVIVDNNSYFTVKIYFLNALQREVSVAKTYAGSSLAFLIGNTTARLQYEYQSDWYNIGFEFNTPPGKTQSTSASWESGTVDLNVFNGWESAKVKIPHSISGLTPGWTVPEFMNVLDSIWYGAGEDQIIIENGGIVPPVPPTPIPETPLGEVPFDDWVDLWGQGIYEQLENQSDALDFIGSNGTDAIEELESIDENIGALEEAAESIDTNIGVGNGILGGIRSLAQSAVNYLEGIAEHVGELVEEIVAGTETLIAGILNQIPQAFGVIFGPIKQASSIWHYVVEWITSIGAPFQFIWSMASGTSYYIILPVYASLAAAVVLAFFKRFGR